MDRQVEAIRFFNYPYQAIEEALVNAVYHRGYDVREPVEVRIMEDRIHIVSYPGPDRSISEKSIEDKTIIARKYRNRRIGEFLKELKLTEGRNTGIPKIMTYLGLRDRRNFYLKYMRPLLDSGKLQMTIPEKPNQKYVVYKYEKEKV